MRPIRQVLVFALLWLPFAPAAVGDEPTRRTDAHGDSLPDGVRLRLGSARLRECGDISAASLSPDGKTWAVPGTHGSVRFWDVASGRMLRELKGKGIRAQHLVYSPDGRVLGVSDDGGSLRLLDAKTGKTVREFYTTRRVRPGPIAFSADGRFVTVGDDDYGRKSSIRVWETDTGKEFGPFEPLQNSNVQTALSANGKLLATWGYSAGRNDIGSEEEAARRRTLQLWDVAVGKECGRIVTEENLIHRAVFAPDSRSIAVINGNDTIDVWELATAKRRLTLVGRHGQGAALLFAPDGRTLTAGTHDGVAQRWDLATGKRLSTDEGPKCDLTALRYTTDGRLLAWGADGEAACIWDVGSGKLLTPNDGHTSGIRAVAFVDGGRSLASVSTDGTLFLWDPQIGKQRRRVEFKEDEYGRRGVPQKSDFVFTPDGRYLVSCGESDFSTRMWEMPAAKEVCTFTRHRSNGSQIKISLDGSKLAAVNGSPSCVILYDVESGQTLSPLQGLDTERARRGVLYFSGGAFSPDGKQFVAADQELDKVDIDPTVHLWDVATGKELARWQATETRVLAFTPDGKSLVANSLTGLRLLEPATGKTLRTFKGQVGAVVAPVVFSPDGRTMVICTYDADRATRTVQLWELATGSLRGELRGQGGTVTAAAFSPDGRTLATGSSDTTVLLWDLIEVAAGAR